jgi:PKD domain
MRLLARPAAGLTLGLLLALPVWAAAGDGPKSDPPAKKKHASKDASSATAADSSAAPGTAANPAPANPAPAPRPAENSSANVPVTPVTPLVGERGTTFTLESGETLGRHAVGFSVGAEKFARAPGDVTVLDLDLNLAVGITDRISAFVEFTPYSHIHAGRPTELSLNPTLGGCPLVPLHNSSNPTIYHFIDCGAGTAGAAYVEDYPFASHNGGGVGTFEFGFKYNLLSQTRSSPIALALRTDFIIPTVTGLSDLLNNEVQNGAFNFQVMLAASRRFGGTIEAALNLPVLITIDPRSGGVALLNQAKQFRPGFGFTVFPQKRVQIISEYTGVIFFGQGTQNTTFGPRDPIGSVSGVRLYPWRNFAIDLGYRSEFGLNQVTDRSGFVIRAGTTFVPAKKIPVPVTLECGVAVAEPTAVEATSGAPVNITTRASASDNGPISYSYDVSGGRIEGSGSQVRWDYSGLPEGTYTISPKAASGKLVAECPAATVTLTVRPAPRLVCSASPSTPVYPGEYVDVTATATDPKGNPLPYPVTYSWHASGGTVEGSGSSVRINTTGLAAGDYPVTARVEGKGGAADCSAPVSVKNIEPAREIARCTFKKFSASVTNACKNPPLDGVPPRFQQFPGATLVIEATADPSETHEAASRAMKTKAKARISPEQLAKDRAQNVKEDLVKRLGLPDSSIETNAAVGKKGAGAANQTMTITLVPQGAKYEPKNP